MESSVSNNSTALRFVLLKAVQSLSNIFTEPRLDKDDLFIYLKKKHNISFLKSEETLEKLIENGLVVESKDKAKVGINDKWQDTQIAQSILK